MDIGYFGKYTPKQEKSYLEHKEKMKEFYNNLQNGHKAVIIQRNYHTGEE